MVTLISNSPEETQAVGESWGQSAKPGLVIGLTGDLGSGKTELVKGLARGLGSTAHVHSPSFALFHQYLGGRLPLFHIDLYRLQSPSQIAGAGLEEYLYHSPGVTAVEWFERWATPLRRAGEEASQAIPVRYRQVTIETVSEKQRRISYDDFGT